MRSWSLVKISADSAQKKLFYKLRQSKRAISALGEGDLRPEQVATIAERLNVAQREVVNMDRRQRGDVSLNSLRDDEGGASETIDRIVDPSPTPEARLAEDDELAKRRRSLNAAIQTLNPRERHIFTARYLSDNPPKLETLAAEYVISRGRVRQIELRSFQKVQSAVHATGSDCTRC